MLLTFNCGIGMIAVVQVAQVAEVSARLQQAGETVYTIGELIPAGGERVTYTGTLAANHA